MKMSSSLSFLSMQASVRAAALAIFSLLLLTPVLADCAYLKDNDLWACYNFDEEATNPKDCNNGRNNLTTAYMGGAIHLNTTQKKLGAGSYEFYDGYATTKLTFNPVKPHSYVAWYWIQDNTYTQNNLFSVADGTSDYGYLKYNSAGKLSSYDDSSTVEFTAPNPMGKWQFAAYVFNGTHGLLYANATLLGTGTQSWASISADNFWLGCISHFGTSYCLHGKLDAAYIFNKSISQADVTNLYGGGAGCDVGAAGVGTNSTPATEGYAMNLTHSVKQTVFLEGEQFRAWANFSLSNGTILNGADCNVTVGSTVYDLAANGTVYRSEIFQFATPGVRTFNFRCAIDSWDSSDAVNLNISNIDPKVSLLRLDTNTTNYTLSGLVMVEFNHFNWSWFASVTDTQLDQVKYSWRNASGVMQTQTFNDNSTPAVTAGAMFVKAGTYNFSVWANDSSKSSTYRSVLFVLNDTVVPSCSGFSDASVANGSYYSWNVTCTDEYLYSFEVFCSNGFSENVSSIFAGSYSFSNSSRIVANTTCAWEVCDGHTLSSIPELDVSSDLSKGALTVGEVTVSTAQPVKSISVTKLVDRYSFCYDFSSNRDGFAIFKVPEGCIEAKNSLWPGHFVCPKSKTWIDFANSEVPVRIDGNEVYADLSKVKDLSSVCFSSVGKFNCVSGVQELEAWVRAPYFWEADHNIPTGYAIFVIGFFFVSIALMFLAEVFAQAGVFRMIAGMVAVTCGFLLFDFWEVYAIGWWFVCALYMTRALLLLFSDSWG